MNPLTTTKADQKSKMFKFALVSDFLFLLIHIYLYIFLSLFQVVKMLVAIIVIFVICWAPLLINNVLIAFEVLPVLHFGIYKHLREAFFIMAYFNSCVNPVVYCFMSKNFKESFRRTVFGCLRGNNFTRQKTLDTRSTSGWNARDTAGSTRITMNNEAIELMNCQYGSNCNSV